MDEGSFDEYHTPEGGMAAIDENTQGQDGAEPEATGNVQEVPIARMHNVQHDGVGPYSSERPRWQYCSDCFSTSGQRHRLPTPRRISG